MSVTHSLFSSEKEGLPIILLVSLSPQSLIQERKKKEREREGGCFKFFKVKTPVSADDGDERRGEKRWCKVRLHPKNERKEYEMTASNTVCSAEEKGKDYRSFHLIILCLSRSVCFFLFYWLEVRERKTCASAVATERGMKQGMRIKGEERRWEMRQTSQEKQKQKQRSPTTDSLLG